MQHQIPAVLSKGCASVSRLQCQTGHTVTPKEASIFILLVLGALMVAVGKKILFS
jgi:hypothetical protein